MSAKWVIPFPSKEALVQHLAETMRNRAYPEFTQSPVPLWATDAAATIADFYEGIAKAAVTYGGADRAHRLLHSALRWTRYLEEPTPAVRDAWIAAAEDELGVHPMSDETRTVTVAGLAAARHAIVQASIALANESYVEAHNEIERALAALAARLNEPIR